VLSSTLLDYLDLVGCVNVVSNCCFVSVDWKNAFDGWWFVVGLGNAVAVSLCQMKGKDGASTLGLSHSIMVKVVGFQCKKHGHHQGLSNSRKVCGRHASSVTFNHG